MSKFTMFCMALVLSVAGFADAGCAPGSHCCSGCIVEGFLDKDNARFETFELALELAEERGLEVLVETGTARTGRRNCNGDGCSTLIFAEWVKKHGGTFYSVDKNSKAIRSARKGLGSNLQYVEMRQSDPVWFLTNFDEPIGFLYMDSYEFDPNNPGPSQAHHLKEIEAAFSNLTEQSMVLIDDCDLPHGGKGKLVIEYLQQRGWVTLAKDYQVLMVHSNSIATPEPVIEPEPALPVPVALPPLAIEE